MELSLFPLNTVLFPGGLLPLRVFEARYLDMVSECLRNDRGFGVCLIREGRETVGVASIHDVGTLAKIVDWERMPDGILGVLAEGEHKLRVLKSHAEPDHLLVGEVEVIGPEAEAPLPEEFKSLSELLKRILDEIGPPYSSLPDNTAQAGWVGARLTELLPLELVDKQKLLELDDPLARLFHLRDAMTGAGYL